MNWILIVLSVLFFVLQVHAVRRFFTRDADGSEPMRFATIKWAALCAEISLMIGVGFNGEGSPLALGAGILLTGLGLALFLWTKRTVLIQGKRLALAYGEQRPSFLLRQGPYRWVRNPFYVSYLLGYLGAAIATPYGWGLGVFALMLGLYTSAAKYEEQLFLGSDWSSEYRGYMEVSGRFVPRLF